MEIYLDNSATTKCSEQSAAKMMQVLQIDYGNPSSLHRKGMEAEKYITEAKKSIAKTLKVNEKEIIFTSGGTEANNLAILGVSKANQRSGKHIITTKIEHPSVKEPIEELKRQGFLVTELSVDHSGQILLTELESALQEDTILVSIMHVNNEVGSIQPIEQAAELIHRLAPKAVFHVDGVQSYGKFLLRPKKMGIDLLSVSGHKINGPKGIGFLYVREKVKLAPILFGGGQQKGIRSGTENVPAIAGIGIAAKECYENVEEKQQYLKVLQLNFRKELAESGLLGIHIHTPEEGASHIISVSFSDIKSEVLLHSLEEEGIYVSSGSACASNKPAISDTLSSMRVDKATLDTTIRFSFCTENTIEEIKITVEALKKIVPLRRKFIRK